jgi:hypothetical protein
MFRFLFILFLPLLALAEDISAKDYRTLVISALVDHEKALYVLYYAHSEDQAKSFYHGCIIQNRKTIDFLLSDDFYPNIILANKHS